MIDFNKLLEEMKTPEYQQRKREREEQERLEEEVRKHTVCFTGHRPDKLGGYNMKNPTMLKLKEKLLEVIEMLIVKENINHFISGGAQGVDQAGFWCVHIMKEKYPEIKNIVAVPFKNQYIKWIDQNSIKWYFKMLEKADEVIYVDELPEYQVKSVEIGTYHIEKMSKRNEYMVDKSRILIAVWDGSKGGTKNCYYYANKQYRSILRIYPNYNFEHEFRYGMNGVL